MTDTVTFNNQGPFYIIEMVQTNYNQYKKVQLGYIMLYACTCTSTQSVHTKLSKSYIGYRLFCTFLSPYIKESVWQGQRMVGGSPPCFHEMPVKLVAR